MTSKHQTQPLNVMFFVEPFPIRSRPLDISWVFHRWKVTADGLGRRGHRPTFVASDAVAQTFRDFPWKVYTPAAMAMPVPCYRTDDACDEALKVLLRDPQAQPWRTFIARVLDAARPDVILTWSDNAPLIAEAKARNILLVHAELGPMRWPHCHFCYFDPLALGYNAGTSVEEVWPHFRDRPLTPEQTWQIDTLLRDHIARPTEARAIRETLSPNGKPLIVHFLQVRRDVNIIRGATPGDIPTMLAALKTAIDPAQFTLVVKPHPGDPEGVQLVQQHGLTPTPGHMSTAALTCASDVTITCNSGAGFEALCQGRIVYTLSESSYAGRGVTRDFAHRLDALGPALLRETFVLDQQEILARQRFLHFMFFRYLVPERLFWDSDAMALRLENWEARWRAGAPVKSLYQEDNGMSVLHELSAAARLAQVMSHSSVRISELESHASARDCELQKLQHAIGPLNRELVEAQGELGAMRSELARTQRQLSLLQNSASHRAIERVRAVPGLQSFYIGTKQVIGRLRTDSGRFGLRD